MIVFLGMGVAAATSSVTAEGDSVEYDCGSLVNPNHPHFASRAVLDDCNSKHRLALAFTSLLGAAAVGVVVATTVIHRRATRSNADRAAV